MADQPVQTPTITGVARTSAACANGDTFINNGRTYISVKNADSASHTVTVTSLVPCNQGQTHHPVVTVAAGAEELMGPFDTARFNDGNGRAALVYSAVTSMSIAVFST